MAEFAYNNTKNATTYFILFELNYDFQPEIYYKEDVDPRFKLKAANQLANKLWDRMSVSKKNLQYA